MKREVGYGYFEASFPTNIKLNGKGLTWKKITRVIVSLMRDEFDVSVEKTRDRIYITANRKTLPNGKPNATTV